MNAAAVIIIITPVVELAVAVVMLLSVLSEPEGNTLDRLTRL